MLHHHTPTSIQELIHTPSISLSTHHLSLTLTLAKSSTFGDELSIYDTYSITLRNLTINQKLCVRLRYNYPRVLSNINQVSFALNMEQRRAGVQHTRRYVVQCHLVVWWCLEWRKSVRISRFSIRVHLKKNFRKFRMAKNLFRNFSSLVAKCFGKPKTHS